MGIDWAGLGRGSAGCGAARPLGACGPQGPSAPRNHRSASAKGLPSGRRWWLSLNQLASSSTESFTLCLPSVISSLHVRLFWKTREHPWAPSTIENVPRSWLRRSCAADVLPKIHGLNCDTTTVSWAQCGVIIIMRKGP